MRLRKVFKVGLSLKVVLNFSLPLLLPLHVLLRHCPKAMMYLEAATSTSTPSSVSPLDMWPGPQKQPTRCDSEVFQLLLQSLRQVCTTSLAFPNPLPHVAEKDACPNDAAIIWAQAGAENRSAVCPYAPHMAQMNAPSNGAA